MRREGDRLAEEIAAKYEERTKAASDEIEIVIDWSALVPDVRSALHDIYTEGGTESFTDTGVSGTFDQLNELAADYAGRRAAELVGKKWVDGQLVDNPNAEWTITEPTRDRLRALITNAFENGTQPRDLRIAIQDAGSFSTARADLISETELSMAQNDSALEGWKASGVVAGSEWILGSEHDVEDECDTNSEAGVVPLGETFPSGDTAPPAHGKCYCDLVGSVDEGEAA